MLQVLGSTWALMLGMFLLMVGNGLQGSLIGVRGSIEGFSTTELSIITSGYFVGFLFGSRLTPWMIGRVGHVRVFAALGSFISAVLILYPTITEPWAWILLRVIFGFSFSGVYVTAESWLNSSSTNETRGQTLSLYMIVQMSGIVASQGLLNVADPGGFVLFIIPSVLVSLAFAPILLAATTTPTFEAAEPMGLVKLFKVSPTGMVGMFLLGFVFAAQFGMASVYGTQAGLSVSEIGLFVSITFMGGLIFQFPIGYCSDRMDRRVLILLTCLGGGAAGLLGWLGGGSLQVILVSGFLMGGMSNPLYSLLIAYTNDYLDPGKMASASGSLLFVNGLGAISGPIVAGWAMTAFGPEGFWAFLMVVMLLLAGYVIFRITRRVSNYASEDDYDAVSYAPVLATGTAVAVEAAQEFYAENAEAEEEV
ncbi:MFS transporter [Rhodobacteraceae bacterium]|nr:MFS transporter [Paracoccaceae bacterium]